jgi:hypothetical protein
VNLHRGAEKALQKGVMQLLSDTGALSQPLVEAGIDARGDLPYATEFPPCCICAWPPDGEALRSYGASWRS